MNLVNSEGSAIFGPGSEWFWSMAQFIVVVVTLVGIYRQLRIARGSNAFEQLDRIDSEWNSERMRRHSLDILLALRDGVEPEDVPYGAASTVGDFWERVALLTRTGNVDRRLVSEMLGNGCQFWWAALASFAGRVRIETGQRDIFEHFEWLAAVMAEMDRKAGVGAPYGPVGDAHFAITLRRRIEDDQDRIRVAEELRAVIVRPTPLAATPASPAAAGRAKGTRA